MKIEEIAVVGALAFLAWKAFGGAPQARGAVGGAMAGSAVNYQPAGAGKPSQQGSGNGSVADALAGIGSFGASVGKLVSQQGGSTGGSLGNQQPGSALWSSAFDSKLDKISTLDEPALDTGYTSWETGADWNASTNSYTMPSYTDNASLGDFNLSAPDSLGSL